MAGDRISIAILALGGQGGGVLADWIIATAERQGWTAQGTSVPGVAQRTGSTIYYVELFVPGDAPPVLALSPTPGDVDVVIASELMEAGRAILRGFVSADRTTLITSTHRVYAIGEKSAPGDGRARDDRILAAAGKRAVRLVAFDMEAAAGRAGSVISSVMLGALGRSGALPFGRSAFEEAIRRSGVSVQANLAGFAAGFEGEAPAPAALAVTGPDLAAPTPHSDAGRALVQRIASTLPAPVQPIAAEGARRLVDYQDARYAALYLDRLDRVRAVSTDATLLGDMARHLALWMSYEDVIRVADLKTRPARLRRVREEVRAAPGQLLTLTEFMHPRFQEVCETMPAAVGRWMLAQRWLARAVAPFFSRGRFVRSTGLRWHVALGMMASLRRFRRSTLRYQEETRRIEDWLGLVIDVARERPQAAAALARAQRLIKGYGDTFERGLAKFGKLVDAFSANPQALTPADLDALIAAALAEEGTRALDEAIAARADRRAVGTVMLQA